MTFHGASYFYLVPILIFGPILFSVLWAFGLKDLFKVPPDVRERKQREKDAKLARQRKQEDARLAMHKRRRPMTLARWLGQGVAYAAFAATLALFSQAPAYERLPPGMAQIKLSLSHAGRRKVECRQRTSEELEKLAPNMRGQMSCSRERWPVSVEMSLDGQPVFKATQKPAGLSNDGASSFYHPFLVPVGRHHIQARLDDRNGEGPIHSLEQDVELAPGQVLVVGFGQISAGGGGFFVR